MLDQELFFTTIKSMGCILRGAATETGTELGGEVDRIAFRNEDSGWTVLRLKHQKLGLVTVTGSFAQIHEGEYVELEGLWTTHKQYGKQFKSTRRLPYSTPEGIKKYLSSRFVRGIGEKTADKIVAHFGVDALHVLDQEPHRLREISSIGEKKAETILAAWRENRSQRDVELFLVSHGLSHNLAIKVMNRFQEETITIVTENPYRLAAEIPRVGFITADKIAMKVGIPADSIDRVMAAIIYCLKEAEDDGHLFLTTAQLLEELQKRLQLATDILLDRLMEGLKQLNVNGVIVSQSFVNDSGETENAHYQTELLCAELNVARKLRQLTNYPHEVDTSRLENWIETYQESAQIPLSAAQAEGVRLAFQNRVFILTGGPGVGKTTTANAIIRLFKAMNFTVALCAPTGRAAQRLSELTQLPASTIHRMLEWTPMSGGFQRNAQNPINAQVIIVDESSMLDIRLADALLDAVSEKAQIIFIGDVDQLPSVGPGNFLRDLIASEKIPYTKLTEIFRQAQTSLIIRAAHAINRGVYPEFGYEAGSDCRFIEVENPLAIRKVILDLVSEVLPRKLGYDPIKDIQVLAPMNKGDLGTQALNEELQKRLNSERKDLQEYKRQGLILRPGDKVIQISNNYDLGVFNGDIGFVMNARVEGGKVGVNYNERPVQYDAESIHDVRLAYAITIHKSQGSEFPVVVIPVTMQHYIMLQRNLIYTALTRAKKLAVFVGTKQALEFAIKNQDSLQRQTRLVELLLEGDA